MLHRHRRVQTESSGSGIGFRRIAIRRTKRYDTDFSGEPLQPPRRVHLDMRE